MASIETTIQNIFSIAHSKPLLTYSPFHFISSSFPTPYLFYEMISYHFYTFNPESSNDDQQSFIFQGKYRLLFPTLRV